MAYLIGTFDPESCTFKPQFQDKLEYGPIGMCAPAATRDPKGRIVLWGWMRAPGWYPGGGHGWVGCMTLPRVLSLREDGRLGQEPADELHVLRGKHHQWSNLTLTDQVRALDGVKSDTLEILAEFDRGNEASHGLIVRRSSDGRRGVKVHYQDGQIHITGADPSKVFGDAPFSTGMDFHVPLTLLDHEETLQLHLFVDRCALELYVNGRACFSRAICSPPEDLGAAVFAEGGSATVKSLDAWNIKPIW